MGLLIQIKCEGCDFQEDIRQITRVYLVDEDEEVELPLESQLIWCHTCAGVREGEVLPDKTQTEEMIGKLRSGDSDLEAALKEQQRFMEDELEYQEMILAWVSKRRSPPRCLECGVTRFDIMFADQGGETDGGEKAEPRHAHPDCAGMLFVSTVTPQPGMQRQEYNPEGELFEE